LDHSGPLFTLAAFGSSMFVHLCANESAHEVIHGLVRFGRQLD